MASIRVYETVDGEPRTFPAVSFTLGEWREAKRDFGVEKVSELDLENPDHLVALIYFCARREDPSITVEWVENLARIEMLGDEGDRVEQADPTGPSSPESSERERDVVVAPASS